MDPSLEVPNIKNEHPPIDSTTNNQWKIPRKMQLKSVKQDSDFLVQSDIDIKMEPEDHENEFEAVLGTGYDICPYNDIKFETDEPMIKIKYEKIMQDPLDVSTEIKVEASTSNLHSETTNKPGHTEVEAEEMDYLVRAEDEDLHDSDNSNNQDEVHVQNKKVRKDKQFICHVCNKTFGKKSHLHTHLLIHSGAKPFECELCKKSFNQKSNLDTHKLLHSGKKPYVCDVCKKVFSRKSHLDTHEFVHSGKKPFTCDICNKSFTQKTSLVVHNRIHSSDKPYACNLCDKAFTHKPNLTKHRRLHTGEKPYSCDNCHKLFAQKSSLNYHKRVHKH